MENKSNNLEQQPELTSSEPASREPAESAESAPSNEYQPVLDQYAANIEPASPEPAEAVDPPQPAPQNITNYDLPVAPKTSFFKVLFTIALIIFIIVIAVLGFTYFKNKKTNTSSSIFDTVKVSPTEAPTITCFLNDKTYRAGESFPSADGCNTCSCTSDSNIVCTEKACTPTVTKSATTSAIPKDWKTYTNSTYGFSFKYPSELLDITKQTNTQTATKPSLDVLAAFNKTKEYSYTPLIKIYAYKSNLSPEDYAKTDQISDVTGSSAININGLSAYKENRQHMEIKYTSIYISHNGYIFEFDLYTSEEDYSQTFSKIYETFKFTDN